MSCFFYFISKEIFFTYITFIFKGYCIDKFEYQCLAAHNSLRARHGATKLTWSERARNRAQITADAISKDGRFTYPINENFQQNVLMASSSYATQISAQAATKEWYSEIYYYNFTKGGYQPWARHFTRVIWNSSRHLGCAKAVSGNTIVIVADYDPRGNVKGEFKANVSPVKASVRYIDDAVGIHYGTDNVKAVVKEGNRDVKSCRGAIDKNGMCREGLLPIDEDLTAPVNPVTKSNNVENHDKNTAHAKEEHKNEEQNTYVPGVKLENFFEEADDRLEEDELSAIDSFLANKLSS